MKWRIDNYLLISITIDGMPDNSGLIQLTQIGKGTNILCSHSISNSRYFISFRYNKEVLKLSRELSSSNLHFN